jgi:hypothetical protein
VTEDETAQRRLTQLRMLAELATAVATVWVMIPEWERRSLLRAVILRSTKVLRASARRAGRAAMRVELASGRRDYVLPYVLSRTADRCEQSAGRMR